MLAAVVQCSPLERDARLDAIAKRFDIRRRTLAVLVSAASAKASTTSTTSASTTTPDRPQVVARGRQLRDIVADTWQAVPAANDPPRLFVRGGVLVRVKHDEAGARLEALDEAATYGLLARVGDWVQVTDEGVVGPRTNERGFRCRPLKQQALRNVGRCRANAKAPPKAR